MGLRRALVISAILGAIVPLVSYYLWLFLHVNEHISIPIRQLYYRLPFQQSIDPDGLIGSAVADFISLAVLCVPVYMLVGAALWTMLKPRRQVVRS